MEQVTVPEEVMQEIATMRTQLREIGATVDVLVNYVQVLIEERNLREKCKKLEEQIDEIRAGKLPG